LLQNSAIDGGATAYKMGRHWDKMPPTAVGCAGLFDSGKLFTIAIVSAIAAVVEFWKSNER
jgi:hypothetical protein